ARTQLLQRARAPAVHHHPNQAGQALAPVVGRGLAVVGGDHAIDRAAAAPGGVDQPIADQVVEHGADVVGRVLGEAFLDPLAADALYVTDEAVDRFPQGSIAHARA